MPSSFLYDLWRTFFPAYLIENEGQFTKIKMMGCNIGQGFFFAKALSVEELEKRGFVSTGPTIITRDQ